MSPTWRRAPLAAALLLPLVACTPTAEPPAPHDAATFSRHVIDSTAGGYQVAAADVDRDGDLDVIALATTPSRLVWYRNPDWQAFAIDTTLDRYIDLAPADRDGDGFAELAVGWGFDLFDSRTPGAVGLLTVSEDPAELWSHEGIAEEITPHRLRWLDANGDGRLEIASVPLLGFGAERPTFGQTGADVRLYVPGSEATEDPWTIVEIDTTLRIAHGMRIVDWDRDGRDDLLVASQEGVTLFASTSSDTSSSWSKEVLFPGHSGDAPERGASEVAVGQRGDGRRFVVTIEPWHGDRVVVYQPEESGGEAWLRSVIDSTFADGHALATADLNGDGFDEIIAGHRGEPYGLYFYRATDRDGSVWARTSLDDAMSAAGVFVADLNGDERLDVIAIGAQSNNVVWYENVGRP